MILGDQEGHKLSELASSFVQERGTDALELLLNKARALTAAAEHQQALRIIGFCRLCIERHRGESVYGLWTSAGKLEAQVCRSLGDFQRALDIYNQLIGEVLEDEAERACLLVEIGQTYRDMGDLETSIDSLKKAVSLFHEAENQVQMAECYRELAIACQDAGHMSQSWTFYQQALSLATRLELHPLEADVLRRMAFLSIKLGSPRDGITYAEQALETCERYNLSEGKADTLAVLGNIYQQTGDVQRALGHFMETVELTRQIGYSWREATALGDLGEIYRLLNDNSTALCFLHDALAAAERVGHMKAASSYLARIAWIYRDQGKYDAGLESLKAAIALSERLGLQPEKAEFLAAMGNLYLREGEYDLARHYLGQALTLGETLPHSRVTADALKDLGSVCAARDIVIEAHSYYQRALAKAEESGFPDVVYLVHLALGKLYQKQSKISEALIEYQSSMRVVESMRQAIRLEESKIGFILDKLEAYRALVTLNYALGNEDIALDYVERMKSRAFLDLLAITDIQPSKAIPSVWLCREAMLVASIRTLSRQKDKAYINEGQLRRIEEELRSLWTELAEVDSEYVSMRRGEPLSSLEIKKTLLN